MIVLGGLAVMVAAGVAALLWYSAMERRCDVRRAEAKVVSSELILRADIKTLRRARSPLVEEAIHLRRRQTEEHRHPESEC